MAERGKVVVVDGEKRSRESTTRLLLAAGYDVESYERAKAFLNRVPCSQPVCVLLDVSLPDMTGFEAHEQLAQRGEAHVVVFLTACREVSVCARVLKRGATDFLPKPCEADRLLDAIERALNRDILVKRAGRERHDARGRLGRLTERERQVCDGLMKGMLNKQIAWQLGIAESTVKVHRSRMMEKLCVDSIVALIHLVDRAVADQPVEAHDASILEPGVVQGSV